MMYEHIVSRLREVYQDKEVSNIREHFAIQFNIWGEGHGALYLEISDGSIRIEPYEYYDRDTLISTDAETLLGIAAGKIDPVNYGDLCVEGDPYGLDLLRYISSNQMINETISDEEDKKNNREKERAEKKKIKEKKERKKNTIRRKGKKMDKEASDGSNSVKSRAEAVKDKAESAVETVKDKTEYAVKSIRKKRKA